MIKRILACATVFTVGLTGMATVAQAQTHLRPRPARYQAKVINLHRAFEAALGHTKPGKISGIVYARGKQPKAAARPVHRACTEPNCPLIYNGGSVQHSPHVYLLLWGPNWSTDSGQEASAAYLESFYAGLGVQPQDNWSTTTSQYGDGSGFPTFTGSVYEGAFHDTSTPPSGATQSQLAAEADAFTSAQGITDLNDAQIVVATQSGTCPQGFYAPGCAGGSGDYCAWHSSSNEPYTNLPYILDSGSGCGEDFVNSNGTYDGFSIVGGHEYAETITDPYPDTGWIDYNDGVSGGEIGDKCAWGGENWGGNDPIGDVTLSTGSFAMQSLWSNSANKCVLSAPGGQDTVTVINPGNQTTYRNVEVSLQVTGTSSGGNPLTWSATGLPTGLSIGSSTGTISGQPHTAGSFSVVVRATDNTGATGSAAFTWTVKQVVGNAVTGVGGKCLDDHNRLVTNGNTVDIYTCNGTGAQRWTFSGGELIVLGECLDDPHSGSGSAGAVIWTCNGHNSQLWTHRSNGEYVLKQNGLCLTDPSSSKVNGTPVQIRTCHNYKDQHWSGP